MKKIIVSAALALSGVVCQAQNDAATLNQELEKLNTLIYQIDRFYTDTIDKHKFVEKVIVDMLQELDPHSVYIPKEELERMNEPLQGNFDGIGIEFNILNDTINVVHPISSGPSEKLGIMAGDKIVTIEDTVVAGIGITNRDVVSKLRGPKGTKVTVGIQRGKASDLLDFEITRDKIPIFSIEASYMATPTTGYIKVSRFAAKTIDEFREALTDLKKEGMENLILDLQGNGGGYLKTAIQMADELINGDKLLVYTEGRAFPKEENKAGHTGLFEEGKLVVLIDQGSASASEIVSGAVQDWDRGLIVGRRSFGKGLVQKPFMLPDGSAVRLTISRYYTPSGRCIQKPYDDGAESYYKEKYDRYTSGELFSLDSLDLPDSLKYFTNNKRVVYGGGGILPDLFVPIDTSRSSAYFSKVVRKGAMNQFALKYANDNRKKLLRSYKDVQAFAREFVIDVDLETEMTNFFANEGVPFDEEEFNRSKDWIHLRFKASVARNIYDNSAFYYVINEINESFNKALEVLDNGTYSKMNLVQKQ